MSNPSMPVSLTEASITWQDVGAPIDSPIASLSTSYESLTSLTCRRLGTNEDLFELLAGSFTNLKSLTIDGCDLRALDRRSDGAPAPTAMESIKRVAATLETGFPSLEELCYQTDDFKHYTPNPNFNAKSEKDKMIDVILVALLAREGVPGVLMMRRCKLLGRDHERKVWAYGTYMFTKC
ncbi:uncharacterized protein STEHIDRAFT_148509 [Stereum hirsutum FP-91666 SS1]|uniref:uncharacterized protein n=1 Tax=Stereum hirsutum (strain FP-91666) TaxID=721885 RepID=UPI000444A566|nr:uncharacterized protein STEHIDRAFT_148509 [Stereum hirsutum FP-91666 SS1]EIM84477.1 hypothetical protein STEHIDRAFT_148509 [Stereum hirsutum FP-91666 SS1]